MERGEMLESLTRLGSRERQWAFERSHPGQDVTALLFEVPTDAEGLRDEERAILQGLAGLAKAVLPRMQWRDLIDLQHRPEWSLIEAAAQQAIRAIAPDWTPPSLAEPTPPNPVGTWGDYFESMRDKPLHPLYAELDPLLPSSGSALELGAGVGQGALHLLKRGLDVSARDARGEALTVLHRCTPPNMRDRLHLRVEAFERMDLPKETFDVVVAGFCLFFMDPALFAVRWPQIVEAIRPGGLWMGQFLGVRDDWAAAGYTAQTREELDFLLAPFEILHLEEAERDGQTSMGTSKHWHVYHAIGRRRRVA